MFGKMIGIEISAASLKLATVDKGKIRDLALESIPPHLIADGRVAAPEVFCQFLKDALKKNHISGRNCALVLPTQLVVSQKLTLPRMTEGELLLNLPYEFQDYLGRDTTDYDFDYIVTEIREGMMDLYGVAVRKQDVEDYYQVFKRAGLTLRMAMPAEMAWLNAVRRAKEQKSLCIIDVGHEKTGVHIYRNGLFAMGKIIDLGVDETGRRDEVAETLAMEILKTLTFYSYSDGAEPIEKLYLCGGANMESLRQAIVKATDLEPYPISDLLMVEEELVFSCGPAIGAALQGMKGA